jgi:hypothetical protein
LGHAGNWTPAGIPGASTDVEIDGGTPVVTTSIGTVRSITNVNSDLYFESAGTNTVTTSLDNSGGDLLVDYNGGEGGTTLNIKGTLTNAGQLYIGNTTLSASDEVKTALLFNTQSIYLTGSSTNQALLDVTGGAGFGTTGLLSGYVHLTGDSAIEFGSGQITSLANGAQLYLTGNDAFIEDSTATGSNSALKGLASIGSGAYIFLESKVAVSTTGPLANNGNVYLDYDTGDSGSSLKVAGALSNTGTLSLGNLSLSSTDSITASSLVNSGTIDLTGATSTQALLDVTTGAAGFGVLPGTLTGTVDLTGDSAIEFASGQITRITGSLQLNGNKAFIEDSGTLGSNSALKGLNDVAGALYMYDDVSITTTGGLLDTNAIYLDYPSGTGGSTLTTGGAISNSGTLSIGNTSLSPSTKVTTTALNNSGYIELYGAGSNQALLDVTGGVAGFGVGGVLTGYVSLTGNTAIEFASGNINAIATSAQLHLNGNDAYVEDSTAFGSNSALNLSNVSGYLFIDNQASVSVAATTGNPTGALANGGFIGVDYDGSTGSSSLKIAGKLTNLGTFEVGNSSLTGADQATVGGLANVGTIDVTGTTVNKAVIDVTGGVAGFGTAGTATGTLSLSGDSAIEFASGQITTVGLGATLHLDDNNAVIEDSATLGSNSALHGLSNIVGTFTLDKDGFVSATGALTINGSLLLDDYYGSSGLSTLSVATGLTNNGTLNIGNSGLSGSDKLTAETLSNTGTINLNGNGGNQALLHVTTGAAGFGTAGTLTGTVDLTNDSAIEFASGQISTIGAASQLLLDGNNAYVEDGTSGSNSALTGLATIAGSLYLENGAKVSTTGALADSGILGVDSYPPVYGSGGSTLSIAKGLTNTGTLDIGNSGLSSSDSVTAASFVNSGTVALIGNGTNFAALDVSGTTTNNGGVSITSDIETLAGAVSGAGSFSLSTANLGFDSTVSAGQTINETGLDGLTLKLAQDFAATINGFGNSGNADTIDATNFAFSGTSFNFVENSVDTGGTLTLTDTSLHLTANILMIGLYSKSSFSLGHDSGTGTLVSFV